MDEPLQNLLIIPRFSQSVIHFVVVTVAAVYDSGFTTVRSAPRITRVQDGLVVLERCRRRRTLCLSSRGVLGGTASIVHATHREGKRDTTIRYCTTDHLVVCDDLLWHRPHRRRVQRHGCLLGAEKQNLRYTEEPPILLPFQSPGSGDVPSAGGRTLLGAQPASYSQPHTATQAGAFALRLAFSCL